MSSRQVPINVLNSLISLIWFLIIVGVVYWFYKTMKRIEQTLLDIKKLLESKA
jgi:ABC-type multidrug transport system permease subunit